MDWASWSSQEFRGGFKISTSLLSLIPYREYQLHELELILLSCSFPKVAGAQHDATRQVVDTIPTSALRWTLLAISMMHPADAKQGVLGLRPHNLLVQADTVPDWQESWLSRIPLIGWYLNTIVAVGITYATVYEEVADFLAEDLEKGNDEWVGKKVALKEKVKMKSD